MNKAEWKSAQSKARQENRQQEQQAESDLLKIIHDAISDSDDSDDPFQPPLCNDCKCRHFAEAGCFKK